MQFLNNCCGTQLQGWPLGSTEVKRVPQRSDRTITQQCPGCQVMSRRIHSLSHLTIHIDHKGPVPVDDKGNSHILVMIDAFSRRVELFPTKTTGSSEAVGCILQHFGRNTRCPAFSNVLFTGFFRSNIPSSRVLIKRSCAIFMPCFLTQVVFRTVTHGTTYHEQCREDIHRPNSSSTTWYDCRIGYLFWVQSTLLPYRHNG